MRALLTRPPTIVRPSQSLVLERDQSTFAKALRRSFQRFASAPMSARPTIPIVWRAMPWAWMSNVGGRAQALIS